FSLSSGFSTSGVRQGAMNFTKCTFSAQPFNRGFSGARIGEPVHQRMMRKPECILQDGLTVALQLETPKN
ncbi:MAG TPA: hypothetical protein VFV28_08730, partial [Limnobacter sp.]|nr:hypothetical protein [Limnobacter sp.]